MHVANVNHGISLPLARFSKIFTFAMILIISVILFVFRIL